MNRAGTWLLGLCSIWILSWSLQAQEIKPAQNSENQNKELEIRIQQLIKQLGDEEWEVREQATQQLIKIGTEAIPRLQKALQDPDLEIKVRAERIIRKIHDQQHFKNRSDRHFPPVRRPRWNRPLLSRLHLVHQQRKQCKQCGGTGYIVCPQCQGKGSIPCPYCTKAPRKCRFCHGSGFLKYHPGAKTKCPFCHGTGKERCRHCWGRHKIRCPKCHGRGKLPCPACKEQRRHHYEDLRIQLYRRHYHGDRLLRIMQTLYRTSTSKYIKLKILESIADIKGPQVVQFLRKVKLDRDKEVAQKAAQMLAKRFKKSSPSPNDMPCNDQTDSSPTTKTVPNKH